MALYVVSMPIGNPKDISEHALSVLRACELVIGEDPKPTFRTLAAYGAKKEQVLFLNEHTEKEEIREIAEACRDKDAALISDAGCPGFCDPGAELVAECRRLQIAVKPVVGPSSLTGLLSLSSENLKEFVFLGFPPRDRDERVSYMKRLPLEKRAFVLMDTPYRLKKLLPELSQVIPKRKALLVCDLTKDTEYIVEDTIEGLGSRLPSSKSEFMILVYSDQEVPDKVKKARGSQKRSGQKVGKRSTR